MAKAKLNPKQRAFIKEYLKDKNAARAARAAGYSKHTARAIGSRQLTKVNVRNAIDEGLAKQMEKAELKAADILAELRKVAFSNLADAYRDDGSIMLPKEMPTDVQAALIGYESEELITRGGFKIGDKHKVKLHDKVKSLELLGKHFKLFTDVVESKVDVKAIVVDEAQVKATRDKIKNDC